MPGVVVLNPSAVDGYGNPISVARDFEKDVNRIYATTTIDNPIGQKQSDASISIVIASDQSSVPVISEQGLANTIENSWPIKISDGYNCATVLKNDDGYASTTTNRLAVNIGQPQVYLKNTPTVIIGQRLPSNYANYISTFVKNGSNESLIVDGSVTPVVFVFNCDSTRDILLSELRVGITTQDFTFNGISFGTRPELAKGVLFEIVSNGQTFEIANIKINEDWLFYNSPNGVMLNNTGPKDVLQMGFFLGDSMILKANSTDKVKVTIRDDLTGGGSNQLNFFKTKVFGMKL